MRIDVKRTNGKKYVQFVDNDGNLYHVGSATDFDAWFLATLLWSQEFELELYNKKRKFFQSIETNIATNVQITDEQRFALEYMRNQLALDKGHSSRHTYFPKRQPFAVLKVIGTTTQTREVWCWNDFGTNLRRRLRKIYSRKRELERRKIGFAPKKEAKELAKIREQNINAYLYVHRGAPSFSEVSSNLLSIIVENQLRGLSTKKAILIDEAKTKYKLLPTVIERVINQLLREGTIYEPRDDFYRIT